MFASDGMRPDLMEKYAKAGSMPTYKELMKHGVTGDNGMVQAFPPNTGVGWYTIATGTYPSEHGSTNNTFHRGGDSFANSDVVLRSGRPPGRHDRVRGRAGRQEGGLRSTGSAASPPSLNGPTVDFATFYSNRGVLVGQAEPGRAGGSRRSSASIYPVGAVAYASGWTGRADRRPGGDAEGDDLDDPVGFAAQNPNRTYNVYFYDSVVGRE